ncbi:MAG: hypothetical protein IJJ45_08975 [Clostridia bacterium]|nr:hypothetical protein [Clostridia bacterium]
MGTGRLLARLHAVGRDLASDLRRRVVALSSMSMGWNFAYGLFFAVPGILRASWWYITLAAYYIVLGMMRLSAVSIRWKSSRRRPASVMRHVGIGMSGLAVVISGMTLLTIRETRNTPHSTIFMITIAAVTFAMTGMAIRNAVMAQRKRSAQLILLRNISCAGAVGSMLSLERSMLASFGDPAERFAVTMEAASGAGAFLIIMAMGAMMIRQSAGMQNGDISGAMRNGHGGGRRKRGARTRRRRP